MTKQLKSLPPPVWVLRHMSSGMKCSLIGNHSLKAALSFMPHEEKSHWFISRAGDPQEILVIDFSLENSHPTAAKDPLPAPSAPKLNEDERRRFQRKSINLRTLILSGNEVFRTHTENISLSGILLAAPAPAHFLNTECKIILQSPDQSENIELSFSFVGRLDNKTLNRMHFGDNTEEFVKKLAAWLEIKESSQAA